MAIILHNFLILSHLSPSTDDQLQINAVYLPWHRQDQLLLGLLRSSLTEPIQAQVVSSSTTMELWSTLQQAFSSTSRARLSDLRRQVQTATKGSLSCSDYIQHMRLLADELAFIGSPITDEDLVLATVNGLGSEYMAFVTAINTSNRNDPISFSDLHGMLLTHENYLKNQASSSSLMAARRLFKRVGLLPTTGAVTLLLLLLEPISPPLPQFFLLLHIALSTKLPL